MVNIKVLVLTMVAFHSFSATTFDFSPKVNTKDPMSVLSALNSNGVSKGLMSAHSISDKLLEGSPTPVEFVSKSTSALFGSLVGMSMDMSGKHWSPDWKTKRNWLKLVLRVVIRKFKNGLDIRKFLDHQKAVEYVSDDNDACPWFALWKVQLGRIADNINDEINFINDIINKKDCSFLRLKVRLLERDLDSVNAMIKYIDEHNNANDDDRKDLICLYKHLIDNALGNLGDTEEYVRALLRANVDPFPHNNTSKSLSYDRRTCPYLRLKERLHWREAVNAADAFGFTYWLNHRHSRNREDCYKLKEAIRHAIWRIAKAYGARRPHRREDRDRRHRRREDRDRRRDSGFMRVETF